MQKLPTYTIDLIEELDRLYPEKCPSLDVTDREIWHYAGSRAVIRMLLALLKETEENALKTT